MHLPTLILGCLLLGQTPAIPPATLPPIDHSEADAASLPASELPRNAVATPELVAEALKLRPASMLTGRPLPLRLAVSSAVDRRGQLEVIHAYWQLVEAVALYHVHLDYHTELKQLGAVQEGTELPAVRASAAALLQEAEVAVLSAQHELAAVALLPPDAPLPLPADRPHVGPYETHFDKLFTHQAAPLRTKLIDRVLPIRRRAIENRASAVQAARDAQVVTVDSYESADCELPAVLACIEQCSLQRRAMIASVCRYNHEIANYALAVAPPGTSAQDLVGMLIEPHRDSAVQAAGHDQQVPTLAEKSENDRPDDSESTERDPAPSDSGWTPAEKSDAAVPAEETPSQQPPEPALPPIAERPMVPVETELEEPTLKTVKKPIVDTAASQLYASLLDAAPAARAKRLTRILHTDRPRSAVTAEPLSLEDCLHNRSGGARRALIAAYWLAWQRAAQYRVLEVQVDLLDGLASSEGAPASDFRLRRARLSARAAVEEARIALAEAQAELATRMQRPSESNWPTPDTPPHAGRYRLKLAAQPRHLAQSWPLRRLAATIPSLGETLKQRATAVMEVDTARAAAQSDPLLVESIEPALGRIDRQTAETFAFVQTLADYNLAIADYALSVLPPETPVDKLVAALVVVE